MAEAVPAQVFSVGAIYLQLLLGASALVASVLFAFSVEITMKYNNMNIGLSLDIGMLIAALALVGGLAGAKTE